MTTSFNTFRASNLFEEEDTKLLLPLGPLVPKKEVDQPTIVEEPRSEEDVTMSASGNANTVSNVLLMLILGLSSLSD